MPVFCLTEKLAFPPPELAAASGLLAVGGDLSCPRLILAYSQGIFPWYSQGEPILWWSPDPRMVIIPSELHVPRRLDRTIRQRVFRVTMDRAFRQVIETCAELRLKRGEGTWLTPEMRDAYSELHACEAAHSVEAWLGDRLVGGVYGLALGSVFFGESMFCRVSNASKVALVTLIRQLRLWDFQLVDCQVPTAHLARFGARKLPRSLFLRWLKTFIDRPSKAPPGRWDGLTP